MTQTADIQPHSVSDILQILRKQAIALPTSSTSTRYLRALTSLESSVFQYGAPASQPAQDCVAMERRRPRLRPQSAPNHGQSQPHEASPLKPEASPLKTEDSRLKTTLTDWLVNQWLMETPFTTASLYLDIISSLYGSAVKAGLLPKTKLFSQLKAQLKALGPEGWKSGIDEEIFQRALRLTKNASLLISDDATAAQLVIYSLTHSLLPLTAIALLKKGEHGSPASQPGQDCVAVERRRLASAEPSKGNYGPSQTIAPNTAKPTLRKARYLFSLNQSRRTPKQLNTHISKIVNALFRRARLPQATDPYQTVEALWAYAALTTGLPGSTIVSHLGHAPLGLPVLKLYGAPASQPGVYGVPASQPGVYGVPASQPGQDCVAMERRRPRLRPQSAPNYSPSQNCPPPETSPLNPEDSLVAPETFSLKPEALNAIGRLFLENDPRWYAMSLRPGVTFTDLSRRINLLNNTSPLAKGLDIQLFYPCEEIARAIGKKIVIKQRPFIRNAVFFRARLTDIGRLFAKIGDLAWCYRQSARPGAPYADISQQQFERFQQTIASFTPDFEVAPTGELELREGDRVEILGGLFAGHAATVVEASDCVAVERRRPRLRPQSKGNHGQSSESCEAPEDSRLKTEESTNIVYRLNIIGDNGIDWRITVDPRLLTQSR